MPPSVDMKVLHLLPFLLTAHVFAAPGQTVLGDLGELDLSDFGVDASKFKNIAKSAKTVAHNSLEKYKHKVQQWAEDGKEYVKQYDMVCKSA